MSAKPTPGPYTICSDLSRMTHVFCSTGFSIAQFPHLYHDGGSERAEANARAWVDGMEASEKLERIRAAMAEVAQCERAFEVRDRVLAILDEDKP